jgi:3-hydroxyacyl-CoA dehydrogenase
VFIGNFQGTYEHPSTVETLKTIKQKHDESLHGYVKHFCNARNDIPYIQDIEIINAFRDGVSDLKTVEKIAMKKLKMVADLLTVADVCIETSEARARLLESRGKGPSRKRDDREVNTVERGDQKDRGGYRYRGKQYSDQKERRSFRRPDNAEKCEIHRTDGHDLEESKTFLYRKKMLPPAASTLQDPRWGEHR